jgi:L-fuconolactonase
VKVLSNALGIKDETRLRQLVPGGIAPNGAINKYLLHQCCERIHEVIVPVTNSPSSPIIDSQIHIWPEESAQRPWIPNGREYCQGAPMTPEAALQRMDDAHVDRAILVPPSWEGDRNDYAMAAAQQWPDRFAVMGRIEIAQKLDSAVFREWRSQPGMLGFRVTSRPWWPTTFFTDGTIDSFWENAERYNIPVYAWFPGQTRQLADVARRYSGLRLIIDHLNLSRFVPLHRLDEVVDETMTLAQFTNVAVKVSSLSSYTDQIYPFPDVQKWALKAVDNFGAARVFWGSDVTRLRSPYLEYLRIFTDELPTLSTDERLLILGRGLADWLGWS